MPDPRSLVFAGLSMNQDDQQKCADLLFQQARRNWQQSIRVETKALGYDKPAVLTDSEMLTQLRQRADLSAKRIAATYNEDLNRLLDTVHEANPRANRFHYLAQAQDWDEARQGWKNEQIAITESTAVVNDAKIDFYRLNGIEGTATIAPHGALCSICLGLIAFQPYSMGEVQRLKSDALPAHVNCPHIWIFEVDKTTLPPADELWVG